MKKVETLWAIVESPKQAELLVKAIRTAELMNDAPYYASGKEGGIYEISPNGKAVSPLVMAIKMGAPAETVKMLLQEAERRSLEWQAKNNKSEPSPTSNKDVVV
jgi:hypothetical protein